MKAVSALLKQPLRIGVLGASGRMGSLVREAVDAAQPSLQLGPVWSGRAASAVDLRKVFEENDVVIDFSHPNALPLILQTALEQPKPLIIATTGWNKESHQSTLEALAEKVPLLIAPNTSVGAYLQKRVAVFLAKHLGSDFDRDIIETHHRLKKDAPSGTALDLAEALAKKSTSLKDQLYQGQSGLRPEGSIGLISRRAGHNSAQQQVFFCSKQEEIELRHSVFGPITYAEGALKAAQWLCNAAGRPGMYTMADIFTIEDL